MTEKTTGKRKNIDRNLFILKILKGPAAHKPKVLILDVSGYQ
jgi:hypothetical protein